jgi:hypothetical protein
MILFAKGGITKPPILPELSLMETILNGKSTEVKEIFFIAISLAQKCESPGFQRTYDNAFKLSYFI